MKRTVFRGFGGHPQQATTPLYPEGKVARSALRRIACLCPHARTQGNQNQEAQRETGGVRDFSDPRLTLCNNLGITEGKVYSTMLPTLFDIKV
ncbi:hypothetical protein [aff. Roholtiella sp. LEGE 12411]|uniref:hypothetical protein n=1 Tax=aff. Roholtiella sp. LEGE 12411 TaxID=1828822 RepID=UPI00188223F6|nr:hypothetical protein [aff. Roholtiella sp. LEGE 12411]MBE9036952.1 hypothetical protein [aff. Roholtiella sp. LEGE 12411]